MEFFEHILSDSRQSFKVRTGENPLIRDKYAGISNITVNLLPAHPFQYIGHGNIKECLTPETLGQIQKAFHFESISFIVNKQLKKEYQPLLNNLSGEVFFRPPSYPFSPDGMKIPASGGPVIDWFDFITLEKAARGQVVQEFPVSLSVFGTSGDKTRLVKGPIDLKELADVAGTPADECLFADHPFKGVPLAPHTSLRELRSSDILIFPKNKKQVPTWLYRFLSKFKRSNSWTRGWYDTTDIAANLPCKKCLKCVKICPAGLHPFMLAAIAEKGSLKDAVEYNIADCSECGLCSYICPSEIPLMHAIVKQKKEL